MIIPVTAVTSKGKNAIVSTTAFKVIFFMRIFCTAVTDLSVIVLVAVFDFHSEGFVHRLYVP